MIRYLAVRDLAVIESVELDLQPGLTVLTGETGAGKSLVIGAIGLVLGLRSNPDLVRTGSDAARVQAIFDAGDREILVRREVSAQGRSRAFLDDELVTTASLREICGRLVDLHGQHDHQLLLDPTTHLPFVDAFGGLGPLRTEVAGCYRAYQEARSAHLEAASRERERNAQAEALKLQIEEVDRLAPKPGEDDELAATRQLLANAERLDRLCALAYEEIYEGDHAILPALGGVWRHVNELAALDTAFATYLDSRDAIKAQLEDLAFFLRRYRASIESSPQRLQNVEDRLIALERLKRRHGPTLADVLAHRAQWGAALDELEVASAKLDTLAAAAVEAWEGYTRQALVLSSARRKAAESLRKSLTVSLAQLALPKAVWQTRFARTDPVPPESTWSSDGFDRAEFFFSANAGEDPRPLARIASGGELSRVMLALKTLGAAEAVGKTLVFDEVDAGIGGEVADVVGRKLKDLSSRYQVLCITHLPQIAAYGTNHLRITKQVQNGRTVTSVAQLSGPERVDEIARMMGGAALNSTRAAAVDLLARASGASPDAAKPSGRPGGRVTAKGKRSG